MSELPFLELGDETRSAGVGKYLGSIDDAVMLTEAELPSFSFPFGNDSDNNSTKIYVSYEKTAYC